MELFKWICTDPDTHQYCQRVGADSYQFVEIIPKYKSSYKKLDSSEIILRLECYNFPFAHPDFHEDVLNFSDYTRLELWKEVCSYYSVDEFDDMFDQTGEYEKSNGHLIILECVFENSLNH